MKTNQSKVAIVTGSSRGIGAAIAKRLASDGLAGTPAAPLTPKLSSKKSGPRAGRLWP
jgi:NAD(P)-dependent dehydrogenase (short-subunit alcohol dehydrogenase family)